jgi:hypothetical protein
MTPAVAFKPRYDAFGLGSHPGQTLLKRGYVGARINLGACIGNYQAWFALS